MNTAGVRTALEVGALMCAGSILGLIGLQSFVLAPLESTSATVFVFLVQVAPVVAVVPTLLARRRNATFWMALVSMLYFVHGVFQVVSPAARLIGALEIFFSLALFAVCLGLLRVARPPGS